MNDLTHTLNAARIVRTALLVRTTTKDTLIERLADLVDEVYESAHAACLLDAVSAARLVLVRCAERSTTKATIARAFVVLATRYEAVA